MAWGMLSLGVTEAEFIANQLSWLPTDKQESVTPGGGLSKSQPGSPVPAGFHLGAAPPLSRSPD